MRPRAIVIALLLGALVGGAPAPATDAAEILDVGPLVLPVATLGEPYEVQLAASGGAEPYRFRARKRPCVAGPRRRSVRGST